MADYPDRTLGANSPEPPGGATALYLDAGDSFQATYRQHQVSARGVGLTPIVTAVSVAALVVTTVGLFALPLNSDRSDDMGYVEVRAATQIARPPSQFQLFSGLARFWWRFGILFALAALGALLCLVVASATQARLVGWAITVCALATGTLQVIALAQSPNPRGIAEFIGYGRLNMYDHAGIGVWIGLAGLGFLAAAGSAVALTARRQVG